MPTPQDIVKAMEALARKRLLVGIPAEKNSRPGEPIGNAAIGYVQELGSPARNIPARPHLVPGVQAALPDITTMLQNAGRAAARGESAGIIDQYFTAAGIAAVNSVKATILAGIPPPLSPATVRARTTGRSRRRTQVRTGGVSLMQLARDEIAAGEAIPLIDTAQYLNSFTFVLRQI